MKSSRPRLSSPPVSQAAKRRRESVGGMPVSSRGPVTWRSQRKTFMGTTPAGRMQRRRNAPSYLQRDGRVGHVPWGAQASSKHHFTPFSRSRPKPRAGLVIAQDPRAGLVAHLSADGPGWRSDQPAKASTPEQPPTTPRSKLARVRTPVWCVFSSHGPAERERKCTSVQVQRPLLPADTTACQLPFCHWQCLKVQVQVMRTGMSAACQTPSHESVLDSDSLGAGLRPRGLV